MAYPLFVWMIDNNNKNHRTALILKKSNNKYEYYRPAGMWEVRFKKKGDKLFSISSIKSVNRKELIECTWKEFKEDNEGYVNDKNPPSHPDDVVVSNEESLPF